MASSNNLIAQDRINLGEMAPLEWPLSLYIEPSGVCNFKCRFCVQSKNGLHADLMPLALFQKIIDEIADNEVLIPRMSICGIGESLINQALPDMLQYMDKRRREGMPDGSRSKIVKVAELVTNGSLFNERLAACIPQFLDRIVISVEGLNSQEYEEIAGVKINFDKFLHNLECLYQNRGSCKIYIKIHNAVIGTREREARFFELFTPISDYRWVENLSDIFPGFDSDLIDKNSGKFRWSLDGTTPAQTIPHKVCPQVFKAFQIFANGDCTLCCYDWERKNYIGNITTTSLFELWHSKTANCLRERLLKFQKPMFVPCKDCYANDCTEIDNIDAYADEILKRLHKSAAETL